MTTLKETITRELLDKVGDSAGLEEVFQRHGRSKGPLYLALAEATALLRSQLTVVHEEIAMEEGRRNTLHDQVDSLDARRTEVDAKVQALGDDASQLRSQLADETAMLERIERLVKLGFGEEQLARLHNILSRIAASHGLPPEDGLAQFFQTVKGSEEPLSFELEAQAAQARATKSKAEAERWNTEAKTREGQSKARMTTVDIVEGLLDKGVKESDIARWAQVLDKSRVPVEKLADDLKRYGSLEGLCRARKQESLKLLGETKTSESRLKALHEEEAEVRSAISSIRDGALTQMEATARAGRQHLEQTAEMTTKSLEAVLLLLPELGDLKKDAERMSNEIALARAIISQDPAQWRLVSREGVQRLVLGLIFWSQRPGNNASVAPPSKLQANNRALTSWHKVSMEDLLVWVMSGLFTEQELSALGREPIPSS